MFIIFDKFCILLYIINIMKKTVVIMPKTRKILEKMGENIRMARLRRNLSVNLVCERASISRTSLWLVEKGSPRIAIGIYAAVLMALQGLDEDLLKVAADDKLGRTLQDLKIIPRKRASKNQI